ncbi:hypothetical protein LCX93_11655 [Sulfurimonas sp. SWIR-19]|uniref:hypothetical protein n=1 Tax=Sulfurimonas sp. SWIR-19 TaxID=2878390 RepID=UPI001CF1B693|nr:hypothetical protein [Sulfurimonas sp. SWIR-19]UCN00163.1 hypothetical protein LCX93_11655 [Sulfurimonas sp. SWIR-19]
MKLIFIMLKYLMQFLILLFLLALATLFSNMHLVASFMGGLFLLVVLIELNMQKAKNFLNDIF